MPYLLTGQFLKRLRHPLPAPARGRFAVATAKGPAERRLAAEADRIGDLGRGVTASLEHVRGDAQPPVHAIAHGGLAQRRVEALGEHRARDTGATCKLLDGELVRVLAVNQVHRPLDGCIRDDLRHVLSRLNLRTRLRQSGVWIKNHG